MSKHRFYHITAAPKPAGLSGRVQRGLLQRKCACGGTPGPTGECTECRRKRLPGQPKLTVNQPGDRYEQEADRVADEVMRMPEAHVQRQEEKEEEEEELLQTEPLVQRQANADGGATAPPVVHDVLRGPGQPLDAATRAFMEPRFGHDFSRVRVHADAQSAASARAVQARAYTVGQDVVFGVGQYAPGTVAGQWLLAHELTHAVQQGVARSIPRFTGSAGSFGAARPRLLPLRDGTPWLQRTRHLVYSSGYPRPDHFPNDLEEIGCYLDGDCEWSPWNPDFAAGAQGSGRGNPQSTFQGFLAFIEKQPRWSITELGVLGHANDKYFGLGGKIETDDVSFGVENTIGVEQTFQREMPRIIGLRDRFASKAKIILFGCNTGVSFELLNKVSRAFDVCVKGFSEPIIYRIAWTGATEANPVSAQSRINSRGGMASSEAISAFRGFGDELLSAAMFSSNVWRLSPDIESCFGASTEVLEGIVKQAKDEKQDLEKRARSVVRGILRKYVGSETEDKVARVKYEEDLVGLRVHRNREGESIRGIIVVGRQFLERTTVERFEARVKAVRSAVKKIDEWQAGRSGGGSWWWFITSG